MLTILPSTVWTSVAQPTEQYGQTLGVAFACLIRSSCACARVGARLAPTLARPPNAVPVKALPEVLKKSRRDRSIPISYGNRRIRLTIVLSDRLSEPPVTIPRAFSQECASQPFIGRGSSASVQTPVWMVGDPETLCGVRKGSRHR